MTMARAQAARMAARHTIFHNGALADQICCWASIGENVGSGPSVASVAAAFLASPEHRANILSRHFTQVAVGTAKGSDGRLYVDEVFRQPDSSQAGTAPATPGPTTTAVPSRRPAPTTTATSAAATTPAAQRSATSSARPRPTAPMKAASTASSTAPPARSSGQRPDRSLRRTPLPGAAQRLASTAERSAVASRASDPLARSMLWWHAMRGLTG
jgi:hypothetical protein